MRMTRFRRCLCLQEFSCLKYFRAAIRSDDLSQIPPVLALVRLVREGGRGKTGMGALIFRRAISACTLNSTFPPLSFDDGTGIIISPQRLYQVWLNCSETYLIPNFGDHLYMYKHYSLLLFVFNRPGHSSQSLRHSQCATSLCP